METFPTSTCSYYSPLEERWNIITHAVGFGLSILGFFLLVFRAINFGQSLHLISFGIFGISLVLLYAASTFYHSATNSKWRLRLNILDHAAIYILIAGTYTPFALVTLNGAVGWTLFGLVWGMAFTGAVLKLFFTGRYNGLSTAMYLVMGWIMVLVIRPLLDNLVPAGLWWLFGGGISYTMGALIFSLEKLRFNHAIFHLFVLLGSFCHFISIYYYVLPDQVRG